MTQNSCLWVNTEWIGLITMEMKFLLPQPHPLHEEFELDLHLVFSVDDNFFSMLSIHNAVITTFKYT